MPPGEAAVSAPARGPAWPHLPPAPPALFSPIPCVLRSVCLGRPPPSSSPAERALRRRPCGPGEHRWGQCWPEKAEAERCPPPGSLPGRWPPPPVLSRLGTRQSLPSSSPGRGETGPRRGPSGPGSGLTAAHPQAGVLQPNGRQLRAPGRGAQGHAGPEGARGGQQ